MRIPAWLTVMIGLGSFAFITALCGFLSYSLTRTAVIDAADRGVEVPSVVDLVDYVLDPPEADELFAAEDLPTADPGETVSGGFELQPTATPDPDRPTQTATPGRTGGSNMTAIPLSEYNNPGANPDATSQPTTAAQVDIPAWQGTERINILVMGVDERGDETFEDRFRTDTMIVVQVDPITKTMGALSLPRDLWVRIPGFQPNRINMANYLGDGSDLPGGGPALAMETIRENFGIRVDYYVQVNFDVFTTVVDTVAPNGVEICVNQEIYDPDYPDAGRGTIEVRFEPGCQDMTAERLLKYARTRATEGGDFDRNQRQQQVLKALQEHVLSVGGVTSLISQIPRLYNDLSQSYRTNLGVDQIMALAQLVSQVPPDDITFGAINNLHVSLDTTEDGDQILIPDYTAIRREISQTFDPQPELTTAELRQRAQDEDAEIVVLNNTNISGLAGRTQEYLTSRGLSIASVGNVQEAQNATNTTVVDFTGNRYTAEYLAEVLGLSSDAVQTGTGSSVQSSADVAVVVGSGIQSLLSGESASGN